MTDISVSRLTELIGSDMSTVSRHLSVPRRAGIVDARRRGNRMICRLVAPCLTGFSDCVVQVMDQSSRGREGRAENGA